MGHVLTLCRGWSLLESLRHASGLLLDRELAADSSCILSRNWCKKYPREQGTPF